MVFLPHSDRKVALSDIPAPAVIENHKALLITSEGNMHDLENELILNNGDIKNDGVVLKYNSRPQEKLTEELPRMHTLRVPRGAEYTVVLADGSTVHLNADSELRYPEHFYGNSRTVELRGEAYFDVAHDPDNPFMVKNEDMTLEVLGTEFDFRCYEGESRTATLVDGKLRVVRGGESFEMEPGDQAYENEGNVLGLRMVDPADYTGWRNERFIYKSSSLEHVMNDIVRWYDMDVEFVHEQVAQTRITANIPRYEDIEKVLNIIRYAVYVDIKTENGVIIVSEEKR
jgi:ferric-dicitrate binding protein FerR (iron transport regulator)